jgi:membrane-anchored protein YejM (alkaline phosphatase superfamily)
VTRAPADARQRAAWAFVLLNYLAAFLHAQRYLWAAGELPSWPGWIFVEAGLLAQVGLAVLAVALLLQLASLADRRALAARLVGALAFTLLNLGLYVDSWIYALFRFHFNGLALNVLLTPGGWESMELPARDVAMASAATGLLFLVELGLYTRLLRRSRQRADRGGSPIPRPRLRWLALAGFVLGLVLTERLIYAAAEIVQIPAITREARLIPLYEPIRLRRSIDRAAFDATGHVAAVPAPDAGSALAYPRAALTGQVKADRRWNIVWIAVESWRSDVFTPETTPHMWASSRKAQVFRQHLSGGNSTRFGIFSMLYGLYGTYWWPVLGEHREPVLLSTLAQAGYRFRILSSSGLRYPEFRQTAFVAMTSSISDRLPGESSIERDVSLARAFEEFVGTPAPDRPFFAFLFLDSPHSPHLFPPEYARYLPIDVDPSLLHTDLRERARRMFNRYRNSVLYVDSVIGRILDALTRAGLDDRTIVMITGDHGQEFGEHGFSGHGSAFTTEQTHVPLILRVPGLPFHEHTHLTQHYDLPPTMLTLLGVDDPPRAYGLGRNMLEPAERPYAVICGYRDCALRDADGWLIFGIEGKTALQLEARDRDYRELDDRAEAIRRRAPRIAEVLGDMRRFLR